MPYETRNCRFIEPASQPRLATNSSGGDGGGDWLWMRCRSHVTNTLFLNYVQGAALPGSGYDSLAVYKLVG